MDPEAPPRLITVLRCGYFFLTTVFKYGMTPIPFQLFSKLVSEENTEPESSRRRNA